jgi:hypothetical protein
MAVRHAGDADEHAEAGICDVLPFPGRAPLRTRPPADVAGEARAERVATRHERRGAMPTEAKRETVAELQDELSRNRTLIVSEYRGLTVKEVAEIRRALRRQEVSYRVVKNRLMRIAAQDTVGSALDPFLTGPTAIAFGQGEVATAKAVIALPRRPDHGRADCRSGDRRRRRDTAGNPAAAGGTPGPDDRCRGRATGHDGQPAPGIAP